MHYKNIRKPVSILALLLFCTTIAFAQDTLNIMFYNVYRFPSANPRQREVLLNDVLSYNKPDLFMVCELENELGADRILEASFQHQDDTFSRAAFVYNQSSVDDTLQQMLYFNNRKFTLLSQQVYPTSIRDINRYSLLLNTTDRHADSVIIEVFVTHLKSSTGTANVNLRFGMIDTMIQVLHTIPTDRIVLLAGDMNFYRSTELAYQHIIDTNRHHILVDPLGDVPGRWQDEATYAYMHTQATRTSAAGFGLYGATGGVDDRFDFIFMSQSLLSDTGALSFVPNSYEAVGNNGNCLNKAINDTTCNGVYSQDLRQKLHDMSDHLPVALKLYTAKTIGNIQDEDTTGHPTAIPALPTNATGKLTFVGSNVVSQKVVVSYVGVPTSSGNPLLNIYNQMGQLMHTQVLPQTNETVEIEVGSWTSGIYYIGVDGRSYLKFMKH